MNEYVYVPGEFLTDEQWAKKRADLINRGLLNGMPSANGMPDAPPRDLMDCIMQGHTFDEACAWAEADMKGVEIMCWIATSDRPPTRDDADQFGCVLAWDVNNGARTAGYQQVRPGSTLSHWQRLPGMPREMAHSVDADLPSDLQKRKLAEICARCANAAQHADQEPGKSPGCRDCIVTCAHRLVCTMFKGETNDS